MSPVVCAVFCLIYDPIAYKTGSKCCVPMAANTCIATYIGLNVHMDLYISQPQC